MYATHQTLVDHESFTFIKRGFDVYTAAWATNTRSQHLFNKPIEFNPLHPYQGKCDFLNDDVIKVLSKIQVDRNQVQYIPEVGKALLDNFDILYVFQVTPWLMAYAEVFLRGGKTVIFRTSGHPLWSWGSPCNYESLLIYPKFHIVASNPNELTIGSFKNMSVPLIMVSIHPELIDTTLMLDYNVITTWEKPSKKFVLAVGQGRLSDEGWIKCRMNEIGIDVIMINRSTFYYSINDVTRLFNSCYFFYSMEPRLLRYSDFEAILHNKATFVLNNGDIYEYMKNGVHTNLEYWHNGYNDYDKFRFYINSPNVVQQVANAQKLWLLDKITQSGKQWDEFLGVL